METKSGQILIVDDHEGVRDGLRSLLSTRPQWKVCGEAADGLEAVEKAKALRPDVVLMDISMPRMDGIQAARIIRRELPESKIVIVSQNDPATVRRQAQEVEAAAYIAKSDLAHDLLPTLDKLTGRARSERSGPIPPASFSPEWLTGGGELGRLIRKHDWSHTSLGPIDAWPQSLKTSVNLILNSRHPMWIGWGKDIAFLYNDAYIRVLSLAKHPWALGRPAAEVWAEIWDICGPLADKVFQKGEASFWDDVRLFMNRGDFLEETYYSFSYSPIRDESGAVAGLFCPSTEVTPKVINTRRLRTLSELSSNALLQKTTEAACASAVATLAKNPDDIPFAVLYLVDGPAKTAHLERSCGLSKSTGSLTPNLIQLDGESTFQSLWPVAEVIRLARSQIVPVKNVEGLPLGLAQQSLSQTIVLPVTSRGEDRPLGVLIAGVNPTRILDAEYRTFYELVAGQIATAIQNVRSAEEERKRAEALAEIDRAKTAFFSNVSHEFRTPLTLMLGPVEDLLAKSHTNLSPAAKGQLELVNRNGSRLLRLVNTLLDFSRIEAGRMQAIYQPTDLAAFTVELASVFRSATEKAGLRLELDCPKLQEPVFVDRGMWEKIVLNLISNAFKFTFEGAISIALTQDGSNVELQVRDTGVGIPPKELPRLFDRFHRIENTRSRTHEGSGIGLALVQELVKLHGGSVRVQSTLGNGSTFIVSLPFGKSHLPAERIGGTRTLASTALGGAPYVEEALRWLPDTQHRESAEELLPGDELIPIPCPPISRGDSTDKRPFILVADDNADMRQYLIRLLSERYDVQAVSDGQLALQAVRERSPGLILTDVMMPNLDGFGLLRELRADPKTRTIPIILLSARAGEESRVEGMEQGADDYLIKPFSARELLARVQTHLEMALVRKEAEEMLYRQRQRFELVAEAAQVGFWFCDLPFDKLIWDNLVKEHFWLPPDADVTIDTFYERIHPDDRERTRQAIAESNANDTRYDIEYRTVSPDGREKWIRAMGRTFYDAAGHPKSFDGLTLDITERKQIEERERKMTAEAVAATAKFRSLFEQTPVFAGIMTLDGIVMDANRLCLEACGYRAEDVLGRFFWDTGWWRLCPESQSKIRTATAQAALGVPYQEILTYHWSDGTERIVDFSLHPIRDHEGTILFLHPTGVDITDLKRAEEKYRTLAETLDAEVRIRTSELEQRNVEILKQSELLRLFSQRLMEVQDEERRHIARELHDSAGQLVAALGMNLATLAEHAQAAAPNLVEDTHQLVQQLTQEIRTVSYLLHPPLLEESGLSAALSWYLRGLTERSGLDIQLTIPDDLGRFPRELELVTFRLVQECLTNIHRHSGSKTAAIHLVVARDNLVLEVQDQGKGISPARLSEIQSQGSGVGIQGMRERIRQFHGTLNIASNGTGTKVSVTLPIPKTKSTEIAPEPQPAETQV
jgi:PAS domain S-box-containing protein